MIYTVRQTCEEFTCPGCGKPSRAGDRAWHEPGQGVYCSAYCAGCDSRRTAAHKRLDELIQHVRKAIAQNRAVRDSGATGLLTGGS